MPFLWFTPAAYRALTALPIGIRGRIFAAALALQHDPHPPGCEKLEGREAWRVRVGDYRLIYQIDDQAGGVTVTDVGPRRDIYRQR
jgi:mRNA interferase RelE/StbE